MNAIPTRRIVAVMATPLELTGASKHSPRTDTREMCSGGLPRYGLGVCIWARSSSICSTAVEDELVEARRADRVVELGALLEAAVAEHEDLTAHVVVPPLDRLDERGAGLARVGKHEVPPHHRVLPLPRQQHDLERLA